VGSHRSLSVTHQPLCAASPGGYLRDSAFAWEILSLLVTICTEPKSFEQVCAQRINALHTSPCGFIDGILCQRM
ncbi:hypothetical protein, partial [Mycobacterium colombiense]|uniref:hypothetical protein n=1 Tax=Mycobacterium colombiense TaxID=339268 RepID=UPI00200B7E34